jgi:sirohydrochlorin ferrochelatase
MTLRRARAAQRCHNRCVSTSPPALVGISHGTSSPDGQVAIAALMSAVEAARPDLTVVAGFVDVQHPDTQETLAALPGGVPAVVVPILLSAGYHVHVDLTEAVAGVTDRAVRMAGALGPDERLVTVLLQRLAEAGVEDDDVVILAVAGSSDFRAVADCRLVGAALARASARPITVAFLAAAHPRLDVAVTEAREKHPGRRVVVSSFLLAPGYFQSLTEKAGADVTTGPLLLPDRAAPRELVELVIERFEAQIAR